MSAITLDDVRAARDRITGRVHRTPVLTASSLGEPLGIHLHVKAELLQKTGSFKARGVLNKLASLEPAQLAEGIVSLSAGNHAMALAWGARAIGARATIVMPTIAAPSKIAATRAYGGDVVLTDRPLMDVVHEIQAERGSILVHPFDDPAVLAGTGTIALEILEDVPDVDVIVVPIGGGGLIGGIASAAKQKKPTVRVIGVEPENAKAMTLSLAAGEPVHIPYPATIADGLAAPFAGVHTLAAVQRFVDEVVIVTEDDLADATRLMHDRTKLYVEPSGAAPLAALRSGAATVAPGATVVLVASGGNVNPAVVADLNRSTSTEPTT